MSASASGFDGFTKGFFRLKQRVMTTFGGVEETVDTQFNSEKVRLDQQHLQLKQLMKSVSDYQRTIREMSTAQIKMQEKMQGLYDASCPMWSVVLAQHKAYNDIEANRSSLEAILHTTFFEPFETYLTQYKTLVERCAERERRRLDMDRYRHDHHRLSEKNPPAPPDKVENARLKSEAMSAAYHALNNELLRDIPRLIDDRHSFFDPLFAGLVDGQHNLFGHAATSLSPAIAALGHCQRGGSVDRPFVITTDTSSAYSQPIHLPSRTPNPQAGGYHHQPPTVSPADLAPPPHQEHHHHQEQQQHYQSQVPDYHTPPPPPPPSSSSSSASPSTGEYVPLAAEYILPLPSSQVHLSPEAAPPMTASPQAGFLYPPLPTQVQPQVLRARALFDFEAKDDNELGFSAGSVITILRRDPSEWWVGEVNGKRGLLPSAYVELIA